MHEKILGLQATLRHIKETHGIDMRNPRGVVIDGKLYPSRGKAIAYDKDNDVAFPDYTAGFYIPFENGLQSYFSIYSFPWSRTPGSSAKMSLEIPTIDTRMYREPEVYRNNPTLEKIHRYGFRTPLHNRSHPLEGQTDIWLSWMGKHAPTDEIGINQLQVRDRMGNDLSRIIGGQAPRYNRTDYLSRFKTEQDSRDNDEQDGVTQGFRGYELRDKRKESEVTLHKILSDWSTLPHHGQLDIEYSGRMSPDNAFFERRPQYLRHSKYPNLRFDDLKHEDLRLTQEELKEHRENYVPSTVYGQDIPPHEINYSHQDDGFNLSSHTYHIDTEELLPQKRGLYGETIGKLYHEATGGRDSFESKWEDWT